MTTRPPRPPSPRRTTRSAGWLAAAGGLAGLLAGLIAFAPARWLALALPAGSPVQLAQVHGSLWQGSAQLWLSGGAGSPDRAALPQRLHWQWRLGLNGPTLALQATCCMAQPQHLQLLRDGGALVLAMTDGRSHWPAEVLTGLGTPWNTLQPSGRMALRTEGLRLRLAPGGLQLAGRASLELQDLGSALSTLRPLGSYHLSLVGGPALALQLQTVQGSLLLSGSGQWQAASGLRFRGEASAAPGREQALGNILNIIGRRDGARALLSLG